MENFIPTPDHTQTPVGSLLVISQRPHLTQIVLSLVREQGFDIKASNHVPNSFIIEADLTRPLTYSNIQEAKDEATNTRKEVEVTPQNPRKAHTITQTWMDFSEVPAGLNVEDAFRYATLQDGYGQSADEVSLDDCL